MSLPHAPKDTEHKVPCPPAELLIDAEDDSSPEAAPRPPRTWLLLLGLVLVAIDLRQALSSLSPLLNTVLDGTGLSAAAAGLLITLPVLCLGLFPVAGLFLGSLAAADPPEPPRPPCGTR